MTKRHDDVFDAVLSGLPERRESGDKTKAGARFLKRGNAISERLSGENEEKTLHWIDPERCKMWDRHNRDYALLTAENCSDLIEGLKAQGRQEFPAIVRRIDDPDFDFEVICGARRHFAISWLRANNYPKFRYLVEPRVLSDEEAFRLADIENRDREDISDYERAVDYAQAVDLYYGGKQKAMAERLEVSQVWLSRYLELARLPPEIVAAFSSIRDIKELHARVLKPMLKDTKSRAALIEKAKDLAAIQEAAKSGQGAFVDAAAVVARLKSVGAQPAKKATLKRVYKAATGQEVKVQRKGKTLRVDLPTTLSRNDAETVLRQMLDAEF